MSGTGDAAGGNAFASAAGWIEATLLGSLATAVAVIAVAAIGLLLLSGRVHTRRAVQVILGCFIIFGASSIAAGISTALRGSGVEEVSAPALPPPPLPASPPAAASALPYDPYAGAGLPARQ